MKNENNVLQPKTSDITARQMNFIHRLLNVTVGTNLSNLSLTEIYKRNTQVVSSRASFNSDPFSCSSDFTDLISLSRLECITMKTFLEYLICSAIGAMLVVICVFVPMLIGW